MIICALENIRKRQAMVKRVKSGVEQFVLPDRMVEYIMFKLRFLSMLLSIHVASTVFCLKCTGCV